jgi:hypothetical protein
VVSQALGTILWYNDGKETRKAVQEMQNRVGEDVRFFSEQVQRQASAQNSGKRVTVPGGSPDKRVPVRMTRGPLDFGLPESRLSREDAAKAPGQYEVIGDVRFEAVNFIDGKRSVADIETALIGEYGRQSFKGLDRYIEDLVKVGLVQWK